MQFNQPLCGNEYQRISYHSYRPNIPPEVVGEGDIASIVLPDGTVHFYFIPVHKHNPFSSVQYKFNINENHFQRLPGPEVWLVRSLPNPSPFDFYNNQPQNVFKDQLLPPPYFESNCNINIPNTGYFQKFHNDNTTSTSDIFYFYPSLRPAKDKPKASTAVQVATPNQNFETVCCKYCNKNVEQTKHTAECKCHSYECTCHKLHSNSDMSVDEIVYKPRKRNQRKTKYKTQKNHICKCGQETSTSDKLITTYTDQSSHCIARDGRETQTTPQSCFKRDNQTDEWMQSHKNRKPHIQILDPECPSHKTQSSNSNMSVEETKHKPSKKKLNRKSNMKQKKHIDVGRKTSTLDKFVTTYTDQSSNCTARDGRETQTPCQKTKKSDIQTEVWVPIKKRQPHIRILSSGRSSCSDSCTTESCET